MIIQKPNSFLTIDPGINIGIVGWDSFNSYPNYTKLIQGRSKDWNYNAELVCQMFELEIEKLKYNYTVCHIERPRFHEVGKGMVAAKSDSLVKLVIMYGIIYSALYRHSIKIKEVEIWKWKGQLDKKKTEMRVRRILPELPLNTSEHIIDAIGIGLYVKGHSL